jgi:VIT1/CCC1 family predicted Fe2+/Mn2+ transporter
MWNRCGMRASARYGWGMSDHDGAHHHHHHEDSPAAQHRNLGDGGLRAAVFGLSDGLVSNTALVLGVATGQGTADTILLAGVAGLLAGAASMAAGEWISMTAQREALEREVHRERDHLARYPADERAHLIELLSAAGLSEETAGKVARELEREPEAALDFHAKVELGIDPGELGSPGMAAVVSFVAFAFGAALPLVPYALLGTSAMWTTIGVSSAALFAAGAGLSRFTPRGWVYSGVRQLVVGVIAAALTMVAGYLVGVSV